MHRVSIHDVAEKAQASITTVSRIINNKDYPVSDELRKRVEEAIRELDYIPDRSARNLRTRSTRTLGLVVRDIADPFFSQIAKGVTETAMELGYMALVCNSERNAEYEYDYLDLLVQQGVEGIMIAGGGYREERLIRILEEKIRIINRREIKLVALAPQGVDVPLVEADNVKMGEAVCDYLMDRNHRHIAFIGGNENVFSNLDRMEGFKRSFSKRGLEIHADYIIHGAFSLEGGYTACRKLLERNLPLTGICCANDNIAVGVLQYLQEYGRKVPEDISVISMGNLPISQYSIPPVTTAAIPLYEMGKKCVEMICSQDSIKKNVIYLPFHIVERKSVSVLQTTFI